MLAPGGVFSGGRNRHPMPRFIALTVCVLICTVLLGPAAQAASVPQTERVRMHALTGPYDFYPASLPPGLKYLKWKRTALSPMACGTNLSIVFTNGGKEIDWSSSRDCNADANVACRADGYPGYGFIMSATYSAKINGRRVYFSSGNHGSNAWACVPLRVGGYADMAVVGIWENFMKPRDAMNLVAYAQPF